MATLKSWFKDRRNDPTGAAIKAMMKRGMSHKDALAIALKQKKVSEHLQNTAKSSTVNLRCKTSGEAPPVDTNTSER
jgi:hypothetical protein